MTDAARARLLAASCAMLAILVYLNALGNPFVYDDFHTVVDNPSIRDWHNWRWILGGSRRILVNASYAIDWAIGRASPIGYHIDNVLLHVCNVVLLFRLTRRAGLNAAFAAAALLAVHPLLTESVGYVAARPGLMCTTFALLGVLVFRVAVENSRARWFAAAVAAWIAAAITKESAVVLPLVYFGWDRLLAPDSPARKTRFIRFHVPLFVVMIFAGVLRFALLLKYEHGHSWPTLDHLSTQAWVWIRYLRLFVLPIGQSLRHPVAPSLPRATPPRSRARGPS